MTCASPRPLFALTAFGCAGLLAFGYYLQFVEHIEPCPMCIFQRLCYLAIVLVTGLGAAYGPRASGVNIYGGLAVLAALIGAAIAGRQTWLQHMPEDQVPACGPGLEFMLQQFPLAEVIKQSLIGTGDCAVVTWTFLQLSIAEWSLICFTLISGIFSLYLWRRAHATTAW